jgi:hypothetical protein
MMQVTAQSTVELRGFELANSLEYPAADIVNLGMLTLTRSRLFTNGVHNHGTLTMADSTMAMQFDWPFGGHISNFHDATAFVTNCDFWGIHIANNGALTVDGSAFSGVRTPTALYVLSGIYNNAQSGTSTVTLTNSSVSGSAIVGIENSGIMTIANTTISGNGWTLGDGGGIFNYGALTVTNSTVSGNMASIGAGIYNSGGTLMLMSTTVSGNAATAQRGSIHNSSSGGTITVTNSLIDGDCATYGAPITSSGHNIESPGNTCGFDQPSDQVDVSWDTLKIGLLTNNGGLTKTHALGAGSVAIDQIPEAMCVDADAAPLPEDQRGELRPGGGSMCDVGSFEVQADP